MGHTTLTHLFSSQLTIFHNSANLRLSLFLVRLENWFVCLLLRTFLCTNTRSTLTQHYLSYSYVFTILREVHKTLAVFALLSYQMASDLLSTD